MYIKHRDSEIWPRFHEFEDLFGRGRARVVQNHVSQRLRKWDPTNFRLRCGVYEVLSMMLVLFVTRKIC